MATNEHQSRLMFQPFSSILTPGFWQQMTDVKLNKLRLSQDPVDIYGTYSCSLSENLPCLASFDHNSFKEPLKCESSQTCPLYGKLICMNVMQDFIDFNKKSFLDSLGREVWKAICDGSALTNPEKYLSRFGLLVYADLKKYKFYYWFSFPAVNYPKEIVIQSISNNTEPGSTAISDHFSEDQLNRLATLYSNNVKERTFNQAYFIIIQDRGKNTVDCLPLSSYKEVSNDADNTIYFALADPSSNDVHPGWPLRNFLALIAVQFNLVEVKVVRIRRNLSSNNSTNIHQSRVLELSIELNDQFKLTSDLAPLQEPPFTGWEKNESQQLVPKRVDLSSLLDPRKVAEDAVNLNLRLMKWRLLPNLDLDKIANTKCLLLGCGTLGCHIARGLLAWGIKRISIVDNSKISYSNPVRQTLYTFDDCSSSGKGQYKAVAAAHSLQRIHPKVDVTAHVFSIPMPGHHVVADEIEQVNKDIERLENLIESHDVTFLLMDTRESRWLPTVIAMSKKKLVINAAIGFDTFLLQRYGIRNYTDTTDVSSSSIDPESSRSSSKLCSSSSDSGTRCKVSYLPSDQLGCYFCNDIVAPGDSTLDRTLDQQCTVSRPGVSMMVSAMAVELLASIVSSQLGPLTPAPLEVQNDQSMIEDEEFGSDLGIVPHSIRGNLTRYHIYMPTSPYFNKCSGCSMSVIDAYRKSKLEFLHRVFEDPSYLEEIAGLKDLQNVSDDVWALESDETPFDDST